MCISSEKLKAHSVHVVWLAAMAVFSFLFWFTITPLLLPYTAKKGEKPSRTYIPEFGMIGLFFWIAFLQLFWCCFRRLTRDGGDRGETSHLIPTSDDPAFKEGLNDSVKKRLGLLTADDLVDKSKPNNKVEKVENPTEEGKGEEVGLQELKVEDVSTPDDEDKPKKRGLISRLSSMRRNKQESVEPEMKIISLPDFSAENSFILLMPHAESECDRCFLCGRNSTPIPVPAKVCKECGKYHYPDSSDKIRSSWNSRKRKDLSIRLGEEIRSGEQPPTSPLSQGMDSPEEEAVKMAESERSYLEKDSDPGDVRPPREEYKRETDEDPSADNEEKILKKRESSFLLQALHEKTSKSEIFFVVNDFGHLVNEPVELAELHGLKH